MTFTIGADPEVFVGVNKKFVSAHDLVPGTKLKPYPVLEGSVQVDGMALEYNINPCESKQEFTHRISFVRQQMQDMLQGVEIMPVSCVEFDKKTIEGVPTKNYELGCSVDFNAYTGEPNETPNSKLMMRTAGGHVHIGGFHTNKRYSSEHYSKCTRLTRLMDKELGIYSLIWDTDTKRRSMYGKAGCFRPTYYGVEYRSLSNLWIFNTDLVEFVYDATQTAYDKFLSGETVNTDKYEQIINNSLIEEVNDKTAECVRSIVND